MVNEWNIAQMNVATALYPLDDQRMSRFVEQLDDINALAERSPGFLWRLQSASGNATDIRVDDDPLLIVNMSVWRSVDALFEFAYKSAHRAVFTDRRKWFSRPDGEYQVLWWVPAGHIPTVDEGMAKLALLRRSGPGMRAFNFKAKFSPPGTAGASEDLKPKP
jgi:heme-degrading monooxygenase HmoA